MGVGVGRGVQYDRWISNQSIFVSCLVSPIAGGFYAEWVEANLTDASNTCYGCVHSYSFCPDVLCLGNLLETPGEELEHCYFNG